MGQEKEQQECDKEEGNGVEVEPEPEVPAPCQPEGDDVGQGGRNKPIPPRLTPHDRAL